MSNFRSAEQVREQLRSPLYFNGLHYPRGFSIHSLNYALGLAAAAERDGARIYENTAALEIDPAGVRKRVTTKDARVRAHHVVLAGNIHLANLMPQFAKTLLPVHTYVIVTAPLGKALHEAIRFPGAVSDTDLADNHYCVVEGDRLMWSGRSTVWRGKPQDYVETLLGQIRRTFPQLKDVKAEYAWTGLLGNTVHRMPQIGEITPGLWLLSRLRQSRAQHHGDGRRDRRARHRRGRPHLAAVLAVRAGVVRRALRPRGAAGVLLVVAAQGVGRWPHGAPPRGEAAARGGRAEHSRARHEQRNRSRACCRSRTCARGSARALPEPPADSPPIIAAEEAKMAPIEPFEAAAEREKPEQP